MRYKNIHIKLKMGTLRGAYLKLILLDLFFGLIFVNSIIISNVHAQTTSATIDKSDMCLSNINCGLSEQSRTVDILKSNNNKSTTNVTKDMMEATSINNDRDEFIHSEIESNIPVDVNNQLSKVTTEQSEVKDETASTTESPPHTATENVKLISNIDKEEVLEDNTSEKTIDSTTEFKIDTKENVDIVDNYKTNLEIYSKEIDAVPVVEEFTLKNVNKIVDFENNVVNTTARDSLLTKNIKSPEILNDGFAGTYFNDDLESAEDHSSKSEIDMPIEVETSNFYDGSLDLTSEEIQTKPNEKNDFISNIDNQKTSTESVSKNLDSEHVSESSSRVANDNEMKDAPSIESGSTIDNNVLSNSVDAHDRDDSKMFFNIKDLHKESAKNLTDDMLQKRNSLEDKLNMQSSRNSVGESKAVGSTRQRGSLAFVFDSTGSMWDDLAQLKKGATLILEAMLERENKPIQNYVLVPYRDPDVGPVIVTSNSTEFRDELDKLYLYGGGDCPESTLSGISAALNLSHPYSYVYVFTDATATDHEIVDKVINLVQKKQSQIVFVLTGDCNSRDKPHYKVYEQIAAASSGQIFHLNKTDVFKVLSFVKDSLNTNRVNLDSIVKPPGNHKHKLSVDDTLKEVTVSVAGGSPKLSVTDPSGNNVEGPPKIVSILDLTEVKIINIVNPEPGNWTITVGSPAEHSVRVTGLSDLRFDHGFSVNAPERLSDTSKIPLKGTQNILTILIEDNVDLDSLTSAEVMSVSGDTLFELPINKMNNSIPEKRNLYATDPFLPPDNVFYIAVNGVDKAGNTFRRTGDTGIKPQDPDKPVLTVSQEVSGHIHEQVLLQCGVHSLVPITAWWFRNGVPVMKKQEHIQSAVIDYLIVDLDEKAEGSYVCKASNIAGHSAAHVNVALIGEPPKVELFPKNITAKIGSKVMLECIVDSQLPVIAEIFHKNDGTDKDVGNLHLSYRGMSTVYLYNFTLSIDTEGTYSCVVTNKAGSVQSKSAIKILPELKVEVFPKIIEFEKDGALGFSCVIHGSTKVEVTMPKTMEDDQMNRKNWHITKVLINNGTGLQLFLDVKKPTKNHEGIYNCYAFREEETVYNSMEARYVEAPSITMSNSTLLYELDTTAVIDCGAEGIPAPQISWFGPDGNQISAEGEDTKRVYINKDNHVVLHNVNPVDEGRYICEAENQFGVAKKGAKIVVFQKPYFLENLEDTAINIYDSMTLPCKAGGIPAPTVAWYFNGTISKDGEELMDSMSNLNLRNVLPSDTGNYTCIAQNIYDSVQQEIYIEIVGLEPPEIYRGRKIYILKEGETLLLECRYVRGKPLPLMFWQKDGVNFTTLWEMLNVSMADSPSSFLSSKDKDDGSNLELIIDYVMPEYEGNYSCIGRNTEGEDRYDFTVEVQSPPKFMIKDSEGGFEEQEGSVQEYMEVIAGKDMTIDCGVQGKPMPLVTWSKDAIPVVYTNIVYMNNASNLVIMQVREADSGVYTCYASNPAGSVNRSFTVDVLVKPVMKESSEDPVVQIVEGQLVVLPCPVYAVPPPSVTWFFNKEPLKTADRMQVDSEYSLRFVANLTDSGVYQCEAVNSAGNTSQEYVVLVFVPPYIYPAGNEVIYAKQGAFAVLDCSAIGFPEPALVWSRNGQIINNQTSNVILDESGRLNITDVSRNNSGTYVCEAENMAGFAEKVYDLVVNEMPNMLSSELPLNIQLLAGENEFNIPCRANGHPTPYITWMKDGKYILNDLHHKIHEDGTLTLRLVTENLNGKYTCQAANTEGSIEIEYQIQVIAPPTLVDSEGLSKSYWFAEGSTATLECPIKTSHVMPLIQWYKDSELLVQNSTGTKLMIANVSRTDASEYSCLATNAGGRVSATFKLVVQWPPVFVNGNSDDSEDVHLLEGEPMKLACHVDANPTADIEWLKDLEVTGEISPILRRNYVKTHHAGEHMCVASNPLGQTKKKFMVHVSSPPTIEGPKYVAVESRLGQPVKLDCFVSGFPKPEIEWTVKYPPDWDVIGDGRIVKAFNISLNSQGTYYCNATNKAGSATKHFNVTVLEPPKLPQIEVNIAGNKAKPDAIGTVALKIGSNATLVCQPSGHLPSSVMWIRNGVILANNSQPSQNSSQIHLENVQSQDSGKYTCLTRNKAGSEENDLNIEILAVPEILNDVSNEYEVIRTGKNIQKWKNMETLERQSIRLECRASGNPVPDIYWFKDKKYLVIYDSNMVSQDGGQVLVINRVLREHRGNYTCVARNSVGEDKLNINLDVWVSPFVEQQKDGGQSFVAKKGQDVYLECPVTSNPVPTIRWMRNPHLEIILEKPLHYTLKEANTTLVIHNVTTSDSGNYTCIGTNILGMVEMMFSVEVVEAPVLLEEPYDDKKSNVFPNGTVIAKIRRGFQLSCNAVANPPPEILWYKDGFRLYNSFGTDPVHISRDGRFLNVMDSGLDSAGKYVCNVHNKVGSVEKEFNVKIVVPAEWSGWSQWGECSSSCGLGFSSRSRECQFHGDLETVNGLHNAGEDVTVGSKLDDDDKDLNSKSSSQWSRRKLSEDVLDKSACRGNSTETRECYIAPCKVNGGWSSWNNWTSCSVACGGGTRRRYRTCSSPPPQHGGDPCSGADAQQEPCIGSNCSQWLPWSLWSQCSVSCGVGRRIRIRQCEGAPSTCLGPAEESAHCNAGPCPGEWSTWSEWSPCSVSCGRGQRRRSRECRGGNCTGGNLQIERCLDIPVTCNKYEKINDVLKKQNQNKAYLSISGKLNGHKLPSKYLQADILEKNGHRYVQTSLNDVLSKKEDYFPYMSFMISPEVIGFKGDDKRYPQNPRMSSRLRMLPSAYERNQDSDDSQIQFATGEQVHLVKKNTAISETGDVMVDIVIDGTIPDYGNPNRQTNTDEQRVPAMLINPPKKNLPPNVLRVNTCMVGYIYNEDSNQCEDVNECETPHNECHSTQMCENLPGSYRCLCLQGYMAIGMGHRCLDVNECLQDSHGCSHECINNAGSYRCACPRGYLLTRDSKTCVQDESSEWHRSYTEVEHQTTPKPVQILSRPDRYSAEDEDDEILITRISPKRKNFERKRRPHKHTFEDDYDYGGDERNEYLSPIDHDEYTDLVKNEGRRISKQSKWYTVTESSVDDDRDIYDPHESYKSELPTILTDPKLESFFGRKTKENPERKKETFTNVAKEKNLGKLSKVTVYTKSLSEKSHKGESSDDDEDDDSYEDEESTIFDDKCQEGYYLDSGKCIDMDECSMNMNICNGVTDTCMNIPGSYLCLPTSCPDTYKRNVDGFCEQRCDVRDSACSEGAALSQWLVHIVVSTSIRETSVPGAILSIGHGGKLNQTTYRMEKQPKGESFYVTTDDTKGTLYTSSVPTLKRVNRLIISSKTYDNSKGSKLLYHTKFIVFLYISD